jgi:DMSO/TMAO reductase YedYZ molybdopterin-dependent catalytic subunit
MKRQICLKLCLILALFFLQGTVNAADERRPDGELKSYRGVLLGSVDDFRENSIKGVQHVDRKKYRLTVDGLVKNPQSHTYDQLKSFPHQKKIVTVHCVEGWKVTVLWEGIAFSEIANRAGVDAHANTVIFHAADGYTTSLELKTVTARNMLLADSVNGIPLPAKLGFPFILVAEDKWGYKWARWIERIEFSTQSDYRGFWEQRGFNNQGDQSGPEMEEQ